MSLRSWYERGRDDARTAMAEKAEYDAILGRCGTLHIDPSDGSAAYSTSDCTYPECGHEPGKCRSPVVRPADK